MSASTVSITANPASARRRPVVLTDKKPNNSVEFVPAENGTNAGAVADDKVTSGASKDLSHHSIRGEAWDAATIKKGLPNSTVAVRRARKVPGKPEKPWWVTMVSVFTKNLVLLVVILGLVQLIRRLAVKSPGTPVAEFTDFEGRIADVEGMMKKTSKMIQVQVDVVDKKLGSEIGGLRKELTKQIEDNTATVRTDLKKLEAKSEALEKSLSELKEEDWLSKQDFDKFADELLKGKGSVSDQSDVSLDDLKAYARDVVLKEIDKHAADGLGRVDYALASGGARVVKHSEPYIVGKGSTWFSMNSWRGVYGDACKMLEPSFGEPGQCFPLKGSSGYVQVKLRTTIIPEAVTLEHVAKSVAYDRTSAPKDCRVSGWYQGQADSVAVDADKIFLLTEFTYDLEKSNAQTFNLPDSTAVGLIDTVRLDFTSNHGSPTHTCIYRLRVHGHEPESDLVLAMQS